jgi:hypothetical protein
MQNLILSSVTPAFTLVDGLLNITNTYLPYKPIVLSQTGLWTKTANAAETAAVWTAVVAPTASTKSQITIIQYVGGSDGDGGSDYVRAKISYTSSASAGSGTEIANAYVSLINAHPRLQVTATSSGATNLVITAKAGFPLISQVVESINTAVFTSWTFTTPGVLAKGAAADLIAAGVLGAETGKSYIKYSTTVLVDKGSSGNGTSKVSFEPFDLYVESTRTITDLDNILNGGYIDTTSTTTIKNTLGAYATKL